MKLKIYQIDAFTDQLFAGNPAAVVPLPAWLPDALMQQIGAENNLSETAFICPEDDGYRIRWFMPASEANICGHATLAAAWVIRHELQDQRDSLRFFSASGELTVRFKGDRLELDFPCETLQPLVVPEVLLQRIGLPVVDAMQGGDYLLRIEDEQALRTLQLDLGGLDIPRGVILTCQSEQPGIDFVSRWFGGDLTGIKEDPVTGSAHCALAPYWANRLDKPTLKALQVSSRGGELECELAGDRVLIRGGAVKFLQGEIILPDVEV